MTAPLAELPWRRLGPAIFLPAFLYSVGRGAVLPIFAVFAAELGSGIALAGLVVAATLVGELGGNLPGGWLVARAGERAALAIATGVCAAGSVMCLLAQTPVVLMIGALVLGLASSVFAIARITFMTLYVPGGVRGRAMSALAGANRLGLLLGPFASAGAIGWWGTSRAGFAISLIMSGVILLALLVLRDPMSELDTVERGEHGTEVLASASSGLWATLRRRRGVLLRVGGGVSAVSAMRASRTTIIPLWAVHIGLDGASTALLVGIAAAIDVALFYPGGALMDRWGRLRVVLPALLGFALAHLALAFSDLLPGSGLLWLAAVAFVMATCNGLTSGVVATIGADLAGPANPAVFLGTWRVTTDLGTAGSPLLISVVTALSSLAVAAGVIAGVGIIGAAALRVFLPRYLPRGPRGVPG